MLNSFEVGPGLDHSKHCWGKEDEVNEGKISYEDSKLIESHITPFGISKIVDESPNTEISTSCHRTTILSHARVFLQ
jgi:hypothetical protein